MSVTFDKCEEMKTVSHTYVCIFATCFGLCGQKKPILSCAGWSLRPYCCSYVATECYTLR